MPVGAIIGSAVLGAGASVYGANKASKAAGQAQQAQTQAANQQVALSRDIYADQRQLHQPYYQAGLQGLYGSSGVMNLMGMGQPQQQQQMQVGGQPQQPNGSQPISVGDGRFMMGGQTPQMLQTGPGNAFAQYASGTYGQGGQMGGQQGQQGTDWNAYLQANPDVAEFYRNNPRVLAQFGGDLNKAAEAHYNLHGQKEGRQLPQFQQQQPQQQQEAAPQPVGTPQPITPGDPAAPAEAPVGPMTQTLRQTPYHQFMMDEMERSVGNSFAARGKAISGAAPKELQNRAANIADGTYQQSVNNAFNLANIGMGSAAQIQGAGMNYGNMAGNAFANAGNAAANGAIGRANAWNAGAQGVAGAVAGGIGMYGGYSNWGSNSAGGGSGYTAPTGATPGWSRGNRP